MRWTIGALVGISLVFVLAGCALLSPPPSTLAPPTDLAATAYEETATGIEYLLSWTDNSTAEIGFRIERRLLAPSGGPALLAIRHGDFRLVTETEADVTTYVDEAPEGTVPEYRVAAIDENGALTDWSFPRIAHYPGDEMVIPGEELAEGLRNLFGDPSSYEPLSSTDRLDAYRSMDRALALYDTNMELMLEYEIDPSDLRDGLETAWQAAQIGDPLSLTYIEDFMVGGNDLIQQGLAVEALAPVFNDVGDAVGELGGDASDSGAIPRLDKASDAVRSAIARLKGGIGDISGEETLDLLTFIGLVQADEPDVDVEELRETFLELLQELSDIETRAVKLINAVRRVGDTLTRDDVPHIEAALEELDEIEDDVEDAVDLINELAALAGTGPVIDPDVADTIETIADVFADIFEAVADELDDGDLRRIELLAGGGGLRILVNDDVTIPLVSVSLLITSISLDLEINPDPDGTYGRDVSISVTEENGKTVIEIEPFDPAKAIEEYGVIINVPWLSATYPDFAPRKITIDGGIVTVEGMNVDDDKMQRLTFGPGSAYSEEDL